MDSAVRSSQYPTRLAFQILVKERRNALDKTLICFSAKGVGLAGVGEALDGFPQLFKPLAQVHRPLQGHGRVCFAVVNADRCLTELLFLSRDCCGC